MLKEKIADFLFRLACELGRPIHGLRPRRMYDWLAHHAYTPPPRYKWVKDEWGCEMYLSPYYFIDRQIMALGSYERDLHCYLEKLLKPGMVVLDIGANIGAMTLHMARLVGPTGKVMAFEPAPPILARLRENVTRNNLDNIVSILNIALADIDGSMELAYADIDKENQGMGSLSNKSNEVVTLTTTVQVRTLDSMDLGLGRCDLIKVDIQGAETGFLKGAANFLAIYKPKILMEISANELKTINSSPRQLCELIESLGYSIFTLNGNQIFSNAVTAEYSMSSVLCLPSNSRPI